MDDSRPPLFAAWSPGWSRHGPVKRGIALRLLAPTVLVSLALVSACLFGALYLNYLHVNAFEILSENVQSTQAAASLETTTKELIRLLRAVPDPERDAHVRAQNQVARSLLVEAQALANLEREDELVREIADGLREYLHRWDEREQLGAAASAESDARLAGLLEQRVLAQCVALRRYNTDQLEH